MFSKVCHKFCGILFSTFSTNSVEYCFPQFPQILWNTVFHKFCGILFSTLSTNSLEYRFPHFSQILWNIVFHIFNRFCGILFSTFSTNSVEIPFSTFQWNSVFHKLSFPQNLWKIFFVEFTFPEASR